jgi:hypothetical protein
MSSYVARTLLQEIIKHKVIDKRLLFNVACSGFGVFGASECEGLSAPCRRDSSWHELLSVRAQGT